MFFPAAFQSPWLRLLLEDEGERGLRGHLTSPGERKEKDGRMVGAQAQTLSQQGC